MPKKEVIAIQLTPNDLSDEICPFSELQAATYYSGGKQKSAPFAKTVPPALRKDTKPPAASVAPGAPLSRLRRYRFGNCTFVTVQAEGNQLNRGTNPPGLLSLASYNRETTPVFVSSRVARVDYSAVRTSFRQPTWFCHPDRGLQPERRDLLFLSRPYGTQVHGSRLPSAQSLG